MATAAAVKQQDDEQPATRFAKDHLKAFVERVERLEEEKKTISDDIRDVYAEAKSSGFDVKALRTVVGCESRTSTNARSRKPSWRPICTRSACSIELHPYLRQTFPSDPNARACRGHRHLRVQLSKGLASLGFASP